jgi:DNA invertase Pin-like site-specific DNA recombinase
MANIGYARVSTKDQSLQLQIDALRVAGCEVIFEEHESGAKKDRPELEQALDALGAGDTLVVYKLDRLSRSLKNLIEITSKLQQKNISLKCTSQPIDTSSSMGMCFFHVLGAIAEFETGMIQERTLAGLEAAKRLGRLGGRPKTISQDKIVLARELDQQGRPRVDIARQLQISRASLYRLLAT